MKKDLVKRNLIETKTPREGDILLQTLKNAGFEAYYVGGCVRDMILGAEPKDWDICTDATPSEMKECFSRYRTVDTGLKHGTLTVLVEEVPFEVTTYRIDGEYSDYRRPDRVEFSRKLEDDLSRRDFTINAMAYHPRGKLVDRFGGREDLSAGVIRCVGEPQVRFGEDALRIMRALRFASRFDFEVEEQTREGIFARVHLLEKIAVERIRVEFDGFLQGAGVRRIGEEYRNIIGQIIPEVIPMFDLDQKNPYHAYDVWEHTLRVVENSPSNRVSRLTAFFHDIGKPSTKMVDPDGWGHFYGHEKISVELAHQVMNRLKYDNTTKENVLTLVQYHGIVFHPTEKYARKLLRRWGEDLLFLLIEQSLADVKAQHSRYTPERVERIEAFRRAVDVVLEKSQCFALKDLAVNGNDLLRMGIPQGKEIGKYLDILLERVIEGDVKNEKCALLAAVEAMVERRR